MIGVSIAKIGKIREQCISLLTAFKTNGIQVLKYFS